MNPDRNHWSWGGSRECGKPFRSDSGCFPVLANWGGETKDFTQSNLMVLEQTLREYPVLLRIPVEGSRIMENE